MRRIWRGAGSCKKSDMRALRAALVRARARLAYEFGLRDWKQGQGLGLRSAHLVARQHVEAALDAQPQVAQPVELR